ncbi:phytanoyl-CoA dioxygenase family protein [Mycobacterium sherrisii]|uniref:phytanoyl-CoA dioxygenase family protein n=1 Tax=Mycobacterium sherrisii TaxID=243061 RepID=UPI003974B3E2
MTHVQAARTSYHLPTPTANVDEAKRNMDIHGCAILRGLITPAQLAALRNRVEEQAQLERRHGVAFFARPELGDHPTKGPLYHHQGMRIGRPIAEPTFQSVRFLANKGRVFIELCKHPVLLELARHTLGENFYVGSTAAIVLRNGAPAQFIHRDQAVLPFDTPAPVMLNVFIALRDYTAQMGATLVAPGSHLDPPPVYRIDDNGNKTIQGFDTDRLQPAEMKAGDVLLFDSKLLHGQGASISDEERWVISIIYSAHWWRSQDVYVASLLDEVYDTLTPEELALFGFEVVRHGAGSITPTRPSSRRYNSNVQLPYIPELRSDSDAKPVPADAVVEEW